ncbi:hypothetical protein ACOMHN_024490 [Nucella lapillus]
MEQMGIIRRSKSPWSSPLHVVPKAGGQWRPCGDYRQLNDATKDDCYPLPHIQDFNNILTGCKIFSKIDLVRGYHQIPMAPSSVAKTAIITPFGLWEFIHMPFGLKNTAQAFQRLMDGILQDIPFTFVYIDDILVASHSHEEHIEHLSQLFKLLSTNGLVINKTNSVFGVCELDFLGHRVTAQGIHPLPDRVAALQDCARPTDRTGLQRFCSLHVDLVGPLPASQGMTYLFTIIDRFTRWAEAIPLPVFLTHMLLPVPLLLYITGLRGLVSLRTLPLIEEGSSPQYSGLSATNFWALKFTQPQHTIHRQMAWLSVFTVN